MNNLLVKDVAVKKSTIPGNIQIVNGENEVLDSFENNLELVDENHKDLRPGNFLIINNTNFRITFSCNYINIWVNKRKAEIYNKNKEKFKPKKKPK